MKRIITLAVAGAMMFTMALPTLAEEASAVEMVTEETVAAANTESKVAGFVERLYSTMLDRKSDPTGKADWTSQLETGKNTGAEVASGFVLSKELANSHLSNEEFVDRMYRTFLDREADAGGKASWVKLLDDGVSYGYILHGFAESQEFTRICADYGINRGNFTSSEPRDQNDKLTAFISRFYNIILGRKSDIDGLNSWCNAILTQENTPKVVAHGFVFSKEFMNNNYSDEQFVDCMYRAFMGREADAAGKASWVKELKGGQTREHVFDGFADSKEFYAIMTDAGIHQHTWVTQTIHHEETGRYIAGVTITCQDCGRTFTDDDVFLAHTYPFDLNGCHAGYSISYPPRVNGVTWVENKPAWDETRTYCSECGAVQ